MSGSNTSKRSLPSWISSKEEEDDDFEKPRQQKNHGKSQKSPARNPIGKETNSSSSDFSKLMEGVVFVLSGFVNPERGVLRSQMLEMGAEFQPDWNSNCTLLVCAFASTPKAKQVKADGGTIVSKDWISECYSQKKLVDIEMYLLNAGKPWRKSSITHEAKEDTKPLPSNKSSKHEEKASPSKKAGSSSKMKSLFSPSKVKKWAVEDLKRTISWLESQGEKPEPSEIQNVASQGILTCLQDAIDALKQGQSIQKIANEWACVPKLIDELLQLEANNKNHSKEDLCNEAMICKQIYELEFLTLEHVDISSKKKTANRGSKKPGKDDMSDDSDATIEMTEDEIEVAYNTVSASLQSVSSPFS